MEWLNYHHLRYFWTVAREGGLRQAAASLRVSEPAICAQIQALEAALGEDLFRRQGRKLALTETGQMVFGYAEDIFALGRELLSTIKHQPTTRALKLHVGIADSFPKLLTHQILRPVLRQPETVQAVCREGKVDDLLAQLATHRLDLVLADEPAAAGLKFKTFSHHLGTCGVTFCAAPALAAGLRKGFPRSLHGAPALLPTQNTTLRRSLEEWFRACRIQPRVTAEFEDAALMYVVASDGLGFIPVAAVVADEAATRYQFERIGTTGKCTDQFYLITGERRLTHPAVVQITEHAKTKLFERHQAMP